MWIFNHKQPVRAVLSSERCTTNSAAVWTISHTRLSVTSLEYHTIGVVPWGKVSPSPSSFPFLFYGSLCAMKPPAPPSLQAGSWCSARQRFLFKEFCTFKAVERTSSDATASFGWFLTVDLFIFLHLYIRSRHGNTHVWHSDALHASQALRWLVVSAVWLDQSVTSETEVRWVLAVFFLCLVRLLLIDYMVVSLQVKITHFLILSYRIQWRF